MGKTEKRLLEFKTNTGTYSKEARMARDQARTQAHNQLNYEAPPDTCFRCGVFQFKENLFCPRCGTARGKGK